MATRDGVENNDGTESVDEYRRRAPDLSPETLRCAERWRVTVHSPRQTERLGERLGRIVEPGAVITLDGDLGAGKTTFVRGLARGMGLAEEVVTSPTFTLIHEYEGDVPLYHCDAYRLDVPEEFFGLGIEEYLSGDGVCVIEWGSKVESELPPERLQIVLRRDGESAEVESGAGDSGTGYPGTDESGAGGSGVDESGTVGSGAHETGAGEPGAGESGTAGSGAHESGAGEPGPTGVSPSAIASVSAPTTVGDRDRAGVQTGPGGRPLTYGCGGAEHWGMTEDDLDEFRRYIDMAAFGDKPAAWLTALRDEWESGRR